MSKVTDCIVALAAAVETSELDGITVVIDRASAERNQYCTITAYPTHRRDSEDAISASGKKSDTYTAAEVAVAELGKAAKAKTEAASRVAILILSLLLCLLPFMSGCVSAEAEAAILTNVAVFDGMARTIEEGVPLEDGKIRRLTYEELAQYVYAGRYGMHAVAFALGVSDDEPSREALGPPGGWIVAPVSSATGGQ